MKKFFLTLVLLVGVVLGLFAQKLTYQAVIRDNNQQLVVNTPVKAYVAIIFQDEEPYDEEVSATTNIHGLLSFEFGGDALNGRDWTNAEIAIHVVNPSNGEVYVGGEPRSVSAVPYALSVNGQSIQNYLTEHNYVDQTELDGRHYLTSDSAAITTMQNDITVNANNIATNTTNITALASRMNTFNTNVCDSVKNCDFSGNTSIQNMLQQLTTRLEAQDTKIDAQNAKIDSLAHIVDSLSKLPHGGGDEPATFTCGTDKVKDADGNEYNTVKIGSQCWMKENLRTTTRRNDVGDIYTNNNKAGYNAVTYGYYYNWAAVMQNESGDKVQGICPAGWHVPSDAEWTALTNYVKSKTEYQCGGNADSIANALSAPTGWSNQSECKPGNGTATTSNATGFSAVPAGSWASGFGGFGIAANFWSATQSGDNDAWFRRLRGSASDVLSNSGSKVYGFSVRCLRDN